MRRIVLLLFALVPFAACSSHVVYMPAANAAKSSSAVNINTATAAELQQLPRIGKTLAERIVEFREINGPFRRPEYLMLVQGISDKRFRQISDLVKTE